jgi:hypothetical protein
MIPEKRLTRDQIFKLGLEDFGDLLNTVLSPANAIKVPELLQGRDKQLLELRQALTARGRHVFIHGFRGVGKTSLGYTAANIIQSSDNRPLYVQCSPDGTLLQLIYDVLKQAMPSNPLEVKKMVEKSGSGSLGLGKFSISAGLRQSVEEGKVPKPESINDAVELICFVMERHSKRPVLIIDEFDYLPHSEHINVDLFIKKLAEVDDLPLKLIICGVGETLESLFSAHLSTYRYFHTIKLDRLDLESCYAIIQKAAEALDVTLDETTMWRISRISDGFPHFVHLICEKVFWSMYNDEQRDWLALGQIKLSHYRQGAQAAVAAANEELRKGYEAAVRNTSPSAEVILYAAADGHELHRTPLDMHSSYLRIVSDNLKLAEPPKKGNEKPFVLSEAQFRGRMYHLCRENFGRILKTNGKGWYEFSEKMMRGYARLKAEARGVELYPDHPLEKKNMPALQTTHGLVEFLVKNQAEDRR